MDGELHVLFGAGQVGHPLAQQLLAMGKRVRVAKRTGGGVPAGTELALGDAGDQAFCEQAARGAAVLYHCMNPPYDSKIWAEKIPRYMGNLIAAASRSKARLVVLDNLYMLGRPQGRAFNEDTPLNPVSRKGEIRARAVAQLFDAHRRGDVMATSGRASDFYGPGGTQTGLGDFFWPRALKGKTAYSPFPVDAVHTYHYIPDVAAGLAALGCADADVYGRPWMLPCSAPGTLRDVITRLSRALGHELRVAQAPAWTLKAMGLFVPIMRELA